MIRVEMLSTGDEVLHGQIVDTNASWLADVLFQHGLPMTSRSTVGDAMSSLVEALQSRSQIAGGAGEDGSLGCQPRAAHGPQESQAGGDSGQCRIDR